MRAQSSLLVLTALIMVRPAGVGDVPFGVQQGITTAVDDAYSVLAGNVDRDGDLDVLSASMNDDQIAWYENCGGPFALATTHTAAVLILEGQPDDGLDIAVTHNDRPGDTDLELATLELLFEESPGDPLSDAEAGALIENLHVYLDEGSGQFESGSDTLLTTLGSFSMTAGVQTISLTDADPNVQVAQGTPETFFVVAELTSGAASQSPNHLQVTPMTESSSSAQDRDHDIPLTLEFAADLSSRRWRPTEPETGWRSGDPTTRWVARSASTPTSGGPGTALLPRVGLGGIPRFQLPAPSP